MCLHRNKTGTEEEKAGSLRCRKAVERALRGQRGRRDVKEVCEFDGELTFEESALLAFQKYANPASGETGRFRKARFSLQTMKTVSGQARNLRTLLNDAGEAKHSGKPAFFLNASCGVSTQIVHRYLKMHTYYLIHKPSG